MSKVETPTLDRMLEIQEDSQLCGEFLKWLQHKYAMLDKRVPRNEAFFRGAGDYINKNELLAEFFEIDLKEAEREKEEVLKAI